MSQETLTSWVQNETPVERRFSLGRRLSRIDFGWDLSSDSFSSSLLSSEEQNFYWKVPGWDLM